ncbi:GntR family transcriptional regulator [Paramixta manurensis]|uniref:GntR family transcriptional regulator n=2 Tax=Paramixta manurensis TaxID=2740817 RepID=A0A6M8UAF7_9GAMM|nr:GntR family transcriptional regulator [Erwiniaceae bacterium PD-1]
MVARIILERKPGERLPNIGELRTAIGVGAGTIQKALLELQNDKLVVLASKQRQGTFIVEKNIGGLWAISGQPPLSVIMPLPLSWEFQGMATGLRDALDQHNIPSYFVFGHGSAQRSRAIASALSFVAVMSAHAANALVTKTPQLCIHSILTPGSYYAAGSVIVVARVPRDQLPKNPRVGIDRHSLDHVALTQIEFPDNNYVDVSYAHIPAALINGVCDVAVWHHSALGLSLNHQELITWPLSEHNASLLTNEMFSAALVIAKDNAITRAVLDDISLREVLAVQQQVVSGKRLPSY